MKLGLHLALATDCHPERSEGSALWWLFETERQADSSSLRSSEWHRDKVSMATGRKGYNPNFQRSARRTRRIWKL